MCSNDDPGLTFDLFHISQSRIFCLEWEIGKGKIEDLSVVTLSEVNNMNIKCQCHYWLRQKLVS